MDRQLKPRSRGTTLNALMIFTYLECVIAILIFLGNIANGIFDTFTMVICFVFAAITGPSAFLISTYRKKGILLAKIDVYVNWLAAVAILVWMIALYNAPNNNDEWQGLAVLFYLIYAAAIFAALAVYAGVKTFLIHSGSTKKHVKEHFA